MATRPNGPDDHSVPPVLDLHEVRWINTLPYGSRVGWLNDEWLRSFPSRFYLFPKWVLFAVRLGYATCDPGGAAYMEARTEGERVARNLLGILGTSWSEKYFRNLKMNRNLTFTHADLVESKKTWCKELHEGEAHRHTPSRLRKLGLGEDP